MTTTVPATLCAAPFRPFIDYVLARRCPTCQAPPWVDCRAPYKAARWARRNAVFVECGNEPETDRVPLQHKSRQSPAITHYLRDVGRAPLRREPGCSYSTLPPRPVPPTAAQPVSTDLGALTPPSADDDEPPPFWRGLI